MDPLAEQIFMRDLPFFTRTGIIPKGNCAIMQVFVDESSTFSSVSLKKLTNSLIADELAVQGASLEEPRKSSSRHMTLGVFDSFAL
jgi:hypothetical protein